MYVYFRNIKRDVSVAKVTVTKGRRTPTLHRTKRKLGRF